MKKTNFKTPNTKNKNGITEVQSMYIDEDEIEMLLKDNLRE